jgi:hypothetical protein
VVSVPLVVIVWTVKPPAVDVLMVPVYEIVGMELPA